MLLIIFAFLILVIICSKKEDSSNAELKEERRKLEWKQTQERDLNRVTQIYNERKATREYVKQILGRDI